MLKEIRLTEALVYLFGTLLAGSVIFLCFYLSKNPTIDIEKFYGDKMRASLFSGFLTLGSFLLALKTGILIKIKEGVYDKDEYHAKVYERLGTSASVYGPLRRLSRLLSVSVFSALSTSVLQMTIGLINHWVSVAFCLAAATFSLTILLASFGVIQLNLADWFDLMEEKTKNKM